LLARYSIRVGGFPEGKTSWAINQVFPPQSSNKDDMTDQGIPIKVISGVTIGPVELIEQHQDDMTAHQ
jgi:hypothetical protein